jgi:hypothetical protein
VTAKRRFLSAWIFLNVPGNSGLDCFDLETRRRSRFAAGVIGGSKLASPIRRHPSGRAVAV